MTLSVSPSDVRVETSVKLRVEGIPTHDCERIWRGGVDANAQVALLRTAEGSANPCRHCLYLIRTGSPKLVLAYRPFVALQPYAESGPIFLHAQPCAHYESNNVPPWFDHLDPAIVRGYSHDDWIRYDTGRVVRGRDITRACAAILEDASVAYVHVRSKYNCFLCRIDRC